MYLSLILILILILILMLMYNPLKGARMCA